MGWVSCIEDAVEKCGELSSLIDRWRDETSEEQKSESKRLQHDLSVLRAEANELLSALHEGLELITDPTFQLFEDSQKSKQENVRLKIENESLRQKIAAIEVEHTERLKEIEIRHKAEVSTLKVKSSSERREQNKELKRLKRKA